MRSLVRSTDVDVLPGDHDLLRRDGYWVVRSPSNPQHYWGNLLIFDRAPEVGDRDRWEALFAAEFPELLHRTFAWDLTDGSTGAAAGEFPDYESEETVGLVATPSQLAGHARANRDVVVRSLDPADSGWEGVLELWDADNRAQEDPHPEEFHRQFMLNRIEALKSMIAEQRGAWYVAEDGDVVVGSLGVVVTDGRARYQAVDTRESHRRRGISSRLVFEAAQLTAARWDVAAFVIAADPDYHAIAIYESLGFVRAELVNGVFRRATRAPVGPSAQ